jgi:hypothetical protein
MFGVITLRQKLERIGPAGTSGIGVEDGVGDVEEEGSGVVDVSRDVSVDVDDKDGDADEEGSTVVDVSRDVLIDVEDEIGDAEEEGSGVVDVSRDVSVDVDDSATEVDDVVSGERLELATVAMSSLGEDVVGETLEESAVLLVTEATLKLETTTLETSVDDEVDESTEEDESIADGVDITTGDELGVKELELCIVDNVAEVVGLTGAVLEVSLAVVGGTDLVAEEEEAIIELSVEVDLVEDELSHFPKFFWQDSGRQ